MIKMKQSVAISFLALLFASASAFSPAAVQRQQQRPTITASRLEAHKSSTAAKTAAALLLGAACVLGPMTAMAETALDFSLPSYDTNMQGFGDGKEAILNTKGRVDRTDPGANEREKQAEAMRKAEEDRLAAKAKKKAELKALEEEANRRAAERKARDAERLKNIWN